MEIKNLKLEDIFHISLIIIGLLLILYALVFSKGFKAFNFEFPPLDNKALTMMIGTILVYIGYKNCNLITWDMIEEELKDRKIYTYQNFQIIPEILEEVRKGKKEYQFRFCFDENGRRIAVPKNFKTCPDRINSIPIKGGKIYLDFCNFNIK